MAQPVAVSERFYEDVAVGDRIPTLSVVVDETQMFFFSAATYNGHRIHYDRDWARTVEGYDDILVQGPLQSALLARTVTDWIGGAGRLVSFSTQNRDVALPGQKLEFGGVVDARQLENGFGLVELELFGREGERLLMPGKATVQLPLRDEVTK